MWNVKTITPVVAFGGYNRYARNTAMISRQPSKTTTSDPELAKEAILRAGNELDRLYAELSRQVHVSVSASLPGRRNSVVRLDIAYCLVLGLTIWLTGLHDDGCDAMASG
jgi:hypothetical protein